jgi:AI-2 transport protein TqsA
MTTPMTTAPNGQSPPWLLPRGLIVLLALGSAIIVIAGMRAFAGVLGPVLLALMLTVAVHPLLVAARRRGWPSWAGVTAGLLAVYTIVLGLAVSLAYSLAQLATLLPRYQGRFTELVAQATAALAERGIGVEQVRAALSAVDFGVVAGLVADLLFGLAGAFSNLVFILALLLFMGLDAAQFPRRLQAVSALRPEIVSALSTFASGTRTYLVVSTVFGAIVAVLDAGALILLGIPLPLLWGLVAFVTNYIPNIGFVIGLAPPALLGLLEGGPQLMLLVIAVYSGINFVIQSLIQPKYVGDAVNLSLSLTFLSLVFWTWVLGPLGAILAVPLTLLAKALLLDVDPGTRWMSFLLTSTAPPDGDVVAAGRTGGSGERAETGPAPGAPAETAATGRAGTMDGAGPARTGTEVSAPATDEPGTT